MRALERDDDRFSLFGETGVLYRNTVLEPEIPDAPVDIDLGRTTIWGVGSVSRLGVIVYF